MVSRFALCVCAVLLLIASGCVHASNGAVTFTSPTVPPNAAQSIKDSMLMGKIRAQVVTVDLNAATHLGVRVRGGYVVITGVVRDSSERSKIEHAVRKISGVYGLDDEIRIDPKAQSFSGGDFALAAHATGSLAAQTGINAANIRVSAENGVITLRGTVPSQSIKTTAVESVEHLGGVKRVVDELRVGK